MLAHNLRRECAMSETELECLESIADAACTFAFNEVIQASAIERTHALATVNYLDLLVHREQIKSMLKVLPKHYKQGE